MALSVRRPERGQIYFFIIFFIFLFFYFLFISILIYTIYIWAQDQINPKIPKFLKKYNFLTWSLYQPKQRFCKFKLDVTLD
jgi:hypothetical protein